MLHPSYCLRLLFSSTSSLKEEVSQHYDDTLQGRHQHMDSLAHTFWNTSYWSFCGFTWNHWYGPQILYLEGPKISQNSI